MKSLENVIIWEQTGDEIPQWKAIEEAIKRQRFVPMSCFKSV